MLAAPLNNKDGGRISIRNVTKVYDPDGAKVLAVDDCSLEIAAGEFCVIVGPSGCGKTTLLNAVAGFHGISDGTIELDGRVICTSGYTEPPSSRRIVVFQNGALFPWYSVLENITFGPDVQRSISKKEATEKSRVILAELGLSEVAERFPGELSSGMKRRVEIARALVNDPQVLLLDEPFRAMDALTKGVVQEYLLRALDKMRKTVLFITHDLEEALFLGDRVVVMTTRPARVKKTIAIDFERPRTFRLRSSSRYLELKREVFDVVHEEARKAFDAGERELS